MNKFPLSHSHGTGGKTRPKAAAADSFSTFTKSHSPLNHSGFALFCQCLFWLFVWHSQKSSPIGRLFPAWYFLPQQAAEAEKYVLHY